MGGFDAENSLRGTGDQRANRFAIGEREKRVRKSSDEAERIDERGVCRSGGAP